MCNPIELKVIEGRFCSSPTVSQGPLCDNDFL